MVFVFKISGLSLLIVFSFLISCQSDAYESMVHRERTRNVRYDSLFLGLHFRDSRDTFFSRCRLMNQQHITADGGGTAPGITVLHVIDTPRFDTKVNMNFYPKFDAANKITEMPVTYAYVAYFPYLPRYQSNFLMPYVLKDLEKTYGNFIDIHKPGKDTIYARVDGNRRILVRKLDDQYVSVIFTDLTAVPSK